MYASARGWVEIDCSPRSSAAEITRRYQDEYYSGGWAFPVKPFKQVRDAAVTELPAPSLSWLGE
jgi:hypothetical protein